MMRNLCKFVPRRWADALSGRRRAVLLALLATLTACSGSTAELRRQITPLSVRGVNYMPRQTPWGDM